MKVLWCAFCKALVIAALTPSSLFAQPKDIRADTLRAKLSRYADSQPPAVLFAHFDKTIYNNTETAWFIAYLLNNSKKRYYPATLTALMVNRQNKAIIKSLKFAMKNGIAYGSFELPDTIATGSYSFILYTNSTINGQQIATFTQHITVKEIAAITQPGANLSAGLGKQEKKKIPVMPAVKPVVKFYPEGGSLVNGTPGVVGLEARDAAGKPLKINGYLLKIKQVIDTISTNRYGMGRFKLLPHNGDVFEVKLNNQPGILYRLPVIAPVGPVIRITDAVANDTLRFSLWDVHNGRYHVIVHNYQQVFYSFHTRLSAAEKNTSLSLKDLPKGLAVITLLDSVNGPCAERLFFAHYNRQTTIDIGTDKPVYASRQKVTVKLRTNSKNTDDENAIVSVACVQASRLQNDYLNHIDSYLYLKSNLSNIPADNFSFGQTEADKALLENTLLIKGWRRYNWQDMITGKGAATALLSVKDDTAVNKQLFDYKHLISYLSSRDVQVRSLINTLALNQLQQTNNINSTLAKRLEAANNNKVVADEMLPKPYYSPTTKKSTMLSTVNVQATKLYNYIANECGDYVCRFNVLNCPMHKYEKDNILPRTRASYTVNDSLVLNERMTVRSTFKDDKGKRLFVVVYNGCANLKTDIDLVANNGLTPYREFYSSDYKQIDATEEDYLSTIFWKHTCTIKPGVDTELTFYTSDAFGPFRIIVQGIAGKEVVYGEKEFEVKNP